MAELCFSYVYCLTGALRQPNQYFEYIFGINMKIKFSITNWRLQFIWFKFLHQRCYNNNKSSWKQKIVVLDSVGRNQPERLTPSISVDVMISFSLFQPRTVHHMTNHYQYKSGDTNTKAGSLISFILAERKLEPFQRIVHRGRPWQVMVPMSGNWLMSPKYSRGGLWWGDTQRHQHRSRSIMSGHFTNFSIIQHPLTHTWPKCPRK